jgi:SAM-dependent methyltransferase
MTGRTDSATSLPRSPATERNRGPILAVLERVLPRQGRVLEIGSGTGEHAVWFATHLPELEWITSDRADNHPGIRAWLAHAGLPNLFGPETLDVARDEWPVTEVDAVFSANTAHIMHFDEVAAMIAGVGQVLKPGGVFCLYGPFRYGTSHTADSNQAFDARLKSEDPGMGIRDRHELERLAWEAGMQLEDDEAMPANNRTLVFRRLARAAVS